MKISEKLGVGIQMTNEQYDEIKNFIEGAEKIKTFECEGRNYNSGTNRNTVEIHRLKSGELVAKDNHTCGMFDAEILSNQPIFKGCYSPRFGCDFSQVVKLTNHGYEFIRESLDFDDSEIQITVLETGKF